MSFLRDGGRIKVSFKVDFSFNSRDLQNVERALTTKLIENFKSQLEVKINQNIPSQSLQGKVSITTSPASGDLVVTLRKEYLQEMLKSKTPQQQYTLWYSLFGEVPIEPPTTMEHYGDKQYYPKDFDAIMGETNQRSFVEKQVIATVQDFINTNKAR